MNKRKIKIVGIVGSLRQESYNRSTLLAAKNLLPEGVSLEIVEISDIPLFNEDVEREGVPSVVVEFKNKLSTSDAIIIATPEYNYSIPGVLKNALDWASRGEDSPLSSKPLAIMSASMGMLGGSRVQYHLRQVAVALNMMTINNPEVFIANAHQKFDSNGTLNDKYTEKMIEKLVKELVDCVLLIDQK